MNGKKKVEEYGPLSKIRATEIVYFDDNKEQDLDDTEPPQQPTQIESNIIHLPDAVHQF